MNHTYPFLVQPLPYSYISLSPYCDPDTLYMHHNQYYAQKVRDLNRLVTEHRLENWTLEDLVTQDLNLPTVQAERVRGTAGAVYNHELYFDSLRNTPQEEPPLNRLVGDLVTVYGSIPRFKQLLREAAASLPGVGWVWLVAERQGGAHIVITDNNDVVSLSNVQPLFVMDLWEHAYFLDYQFDVAQYVEVWLSFLDWEKANARYLSSRA
jgi:Fe-Mn family superoxide dismutase